MIQLAPQSKYECLGLFKWLRPVAKGMVTFYSALDHLPIPSALQISRFFTQISNRLIDTLYFCWITFDIQKKDVRVQYLWHKLVKKAYCYQKLFWHFPVWINRSSGLKIFENSWPSASIFKCFSQSLEHFFLTVGQNNYGNKIPLLPFNASHGKVSVKYLSNRI